MSIDTKLKELIINTLSPEQFEGITPSTEEIYLVEDDAEYATVEELASKQDKLTAGNGIDITNNKISNNNQFVITEDMFDLEYDDTKGVAPYNTSYGYTNITIHDNVGIEWVEGASYTFVLDTKVATSTYRNVRIRIGESGDWKPLMTRSGAIAPGSTYFIKAMNIPFQYSNKYQTTGALNSVEYNSTYSINYSFDNGQHTGGVGAYAITRYSLCMQKPDMTWEKITATNKNYTTTANKEVNKTGFLLNHIRYYGTTTNIANGALIPANVMYTKSASVDASYSFNCTTTPNWGIGKQVYLVGTIGDDGLFYLDENQWWSVELPTSNDGKLYIRIGLTYNATNATITFLDDRPIVYHDGTGIKQYIEHDVTKQDVITDLATIRDGASKGSTAIQQVKTINGEDIIGSGNIEIKSAPDLDNVTISKNSNDELQAIAVIDNNNNAIKTWTGTQAEYEAIAVKDSNTLYNVTDTNDVSYPLLEAIYPVGSIYIGTMAICPLQALFGTWQVKDNPRFVVESGEENGINYRVYNDGYCEQWSTLRIDDTEHIIYFVKEYEGYNPNNGIYDLQITQSGDGSTSAQYYGAVKCIVQDTNRFIAYSGQRENPFFDWKASGYLKDDQYTAKNYYLFERVA